MSHNPNNKKCPRYPCAFHPIGKYCAGCERGYACHCPSTIFEGDNSSLKKTFDEAARHDPENKACAQAGYGDNYHGLGKIDCTCPAQKEECPPKYTVREVLDSLYFEEVDHDGDFDGYIHLTSNIDGSGTDLNISDLKLSNALSEARGREATIAAFVEWAKEYAVECYGDQKHVHLSILLSFASSLKSNAPKV